MGTLDVSIGVMQETKLMGRIYTRNSGGYNVVTTDAPSTRQGGIALCWKESEHYEVGETKIWGPNVLTFELVMGEDLCYVVGAYIPPSNLSTLEHVESAWWQCPKGCKPLLIRDLNINLESPWQSWNRWTLWT